MLADPAGTNRTRQRTKDRGQDAAAGSTAAPPVGHVGSELRLAAAVRAELTDDDSVVVGDQHLAVDVDELRHQLPPQLSVSPQAGDGDVVHPLISHWNPEPEPEVTLRVWAGGSKC